MINLNTPKDQLATNTVVTLNFSEFEITWAEDCLNALDVLTGSLLFFDYDVWNIQQFADKIVLTPDFDYDWSEDDGYPEEAWY